MSESIVGRLIALGWKEGPGGVLQPAASSPTLNLESDALGDRYSFPEEVVTDHWEAVFQQDAAQVERIEGSR